MTESYIDDDSGEPESIPDDPTETDEDQPAAPEIRDSGDAGDEPPKE